MTHWTPASSIAALAGLLLASCADPAQTPDAGPFPSLPECIGYWPVMGAPIDHDYMEGSAPGVQYRLWRCDWERAPGLAYGYRADAFELVVGDRVFQVTAAQLEYDVTLHNWQDSLVGTHPDAILRWRRSTDINTLDTSYFVSATDLVGGEILAETRVE